MRMLFMPKPMLLGDLDVWVKPESKRCVACYPLHASHPLSLL